MTSLVNVLKSWEAGYSPHRGATNPHLGDLCGACTVGSAYQRRNFEGSALGCLNEKSRLASCIRSEVNSELNFSLNFEGLVLGCIDADFCK